MCLNTFPTHLKITNTSDEIVQNIKLILPLNSSSICTLVRERGNMNFDATIKEIEVGNLYPLESAHLYCKFDPTLPNLTIETLPLKIEAANENHLTFIHIKMFTNSLAP